MKRNVARMATALFAAALADPYRDWINPEIHVSKFSDKSRSLFREPHRELKEFSIKGRKVMAYSKKDAITRLKHMKKK